MTIYVNDVVLDAPIDKIITEADAIHIVDAFTSDYTSAVAASLGSFTPSITKGDSAASGAGRKGIIAAASGIAIGADGDFNHYVVVDDDTNTVLYVGDGTTKALTTGDTVSTPEFNINFSDGVLAT